MVKYIKIIIDKIKIPVYNLPIIKLGGNTNG